jgi:C4-dicarboxylate transporter, DctM subunit
MILVAAIGIAVLAVLGAPLFLILSSSALLGFASTGRPPADVTGEISKLVQWDTLITIPLFTFAGYCLAQSGAPKRLVEVSRALFGWIPGGMALVTLVTCAFFTTFTGASSITIVALGGLLLPVLLQQKYPRTFAVGLVTTGGSRGLLFPPSLPVIIYGYVAGVDITRLYIAGIVPGLIDVALIAVLCVWTGVFRKVPRTPFDPRGAVRALGRALPEVLIPVMVLGLIISGVLKVPEAAAVTALYVLIIEVALYRDIHPIRDLPRVTKEAMVLCGVITVLIAGSLGLTNFLVDAHVPEALVAGIRSAIHSKWVFLIVLNIFLLCVGALMDIFSAIVAVPLILPLAVEYGIHPLHLGIIFLLNLEIAYSTPPVGLNLVISSFFFRQPIMRLYRAAFPFLLVALIVLAAVTYIEPLSTFTAPKGGATIEGGMGGSPTKKAGKAVPKAGAKAGTAAGTAAGAPTIDGICDKNLPNDPDCEEEVIEDDDDDTGAKKKDGKKKNEGGGDVKDRPGAASAPVKKK